MGAHSLGPLVSTQSPGPQRCRSLIALTWQVFPRRCAPRAFFSWRLSRAFAPRRIVLAIHAASCARIWNEAMRSSMPGHVALQIVVHSASSEQLRPPCPRSRAQSKPMTVPSEGRRSYFFSRVELSMYHRMIAALNSSAVKIRKFWSGRRGPSFITHR